MKKHDLIKFLGYVGTVVAVLMFISLLEIARSNIVDGTKIFIVPLVTTINCSIWSLYAYLKKEWFVFAANIPGVLLGFITLLSAFI